VPTSIIVVKGWLSNFGLLGVAKPFFIKAINLFALDPTVWFQVIDAGSPDTEL